MVVEVAGSRWHGVRRVSIQNVSVCAGKTPTGFEHMGVSQAHTTHGDAHVHTYKQVARSPGSYKKVG